MKKLGLIAGYGAVTYVVKFCSQSLKHSINKSFTTYFFGHFSASCPLIVLPLIQKKKWWINVFGHFLWKNCRMIIEFLRGLSYRLAFLYMPCAKRSQCKCRHTLFINSIYQVLTPQLHWTPLVWNVITIVLHL